MSPNTPHRVQLSRKAGWKMPPGTIKVDRSTRWGNRWKVGHTRCVPVGGGCHDFEKIEDSSAAVKCFREMLAFVDRNYPADEEIVAKLRGKNLACWCKLDQPCHADVLLEIANR